MSNAIATKKPLETLRDMLEVAKPTIAKYVNGDVLTAQRMTAVAIACASRTPRLLECSAGSIVRAVIQGAELGLEAGSSLGDAYLVPYLNRKTGQYEAQFQPGYRGLARLAIEEGLAVKIDCVPVYAADSFEWDDKFLPPKPKHKPAPLSTTDRGAMIGVYCVVTLPGKDQKWEVMTMAEVNSIKARSQSGKKNEGPWLTDPIEMAKKTVWKRTCKYLGIKPGSRMARAVERDEAAEDGEEVVEVAIDPLPAPVEVIPAVLTGPTNLADLTAKMRKAVKTPAFNDNSYEGPAGNEPPADVKLPGEEE